MTSLAAAACATGDPYAAARLLGHAGALRDETGAVLRGVEQRLHDETVATLEECLSPIDLSEAMTRGASDSVEELVDLLDALEHTAQRGSVS
jgi:hypothetical protein